MGAVGLFGHPDHCSTKPAQRIFYSPTSCGLTDRHRMCRRRKFVLASTEFPEGNPNSARPRGCRTFGLSSRVKVRLSHRLILRGSMFRMRGTLLNTATVAVGTCIGLALRSVLPPSLEEVALHGLGLVTIGMSIKMFLQAKNLLIVAIAIAIGGLIGAGIGIQNGIEVFAEWAKQRSGQGDSKLFAEGIITSFVLFCVGPMTLLGCIQDAVEKKIELLALKSTMDGIAAVFLAAATGAGLLVTAVLVLVFQGTLTLLARPLQPIAKDEDMLGETTGVGGAMLLATGIGLLGLANLKGANYLPALFIAPLLVVLERKLLRKPV